MKRVKRRKLEEFIALVPKKKNLFCDIDINGTTDEAKLLEDFCEIKAKRNRIEEAWTHIIYFISEDIKAVDQINFLTEKTLRFLIENEIALIELGHLQLSDDWLQKIYDKNNRCIEAIQTIELRKKK